MQPISESSVVTTNLKTIGTIVAFVLIAGSLYWANRNDISHLQERIKTLEGQLVRQEQEIQRLEVDMARLGARK